MYLRSRCQSMRQSFLGLVPLLLRLVQQVLEVLEVLVGQLGLECRVRLYSLLGLEAQSRLLGLVCQVRLEALDRL